MGEAYPRKPTLLIQAPLLEASGADSRGYRSEGSLFAQSEVGSRCVIIAPVMHRSVSMSLDSGYVGQPGPDKDTS